MSMATRMKKKFQTKQDHSVRNITFIILTMVLAVGLYVSVDIELTPKYTVQQTGTMNVPVYSLTAK